MPATVADACRQIADEFVSESVQFLRTWRFLEFLSLLRLGQCCAVMTSEFWITGHNHDQS